MLALRSVVLATPLLLAAVAPARAQPDPFDEEALARALWQRSPALAVARQDLIEAEAGRDRAFLLPNPQLSASWGTIPFGRRNPPTISRWDVPNYNVGLDTLIELGKRGPRQRASEAALRGTRLEVADVFRREYFALLELLADQAEATARAAVLERLVADSAEGLRLQRARAEKGDVAGLEVDRLEVEHLRLQSSLRELASQREGALATCASVLGAACPRFAGEAEARRFLAQGAATPSLVAVAARPDLQALAAREDQAREELVLARRQVIPDPVVGVGYTHDRFLESGNQGNSVNLGVSLPLPVFDRGQVDAARARRAGQQAAATRVALTAAAEQTMAAGRARLAVLAERARTLDEEAVPRARNVLSRMEQAARGGGVALQDVLLSRRALEELQLDRVEVAAERYRALLDVRRQAGSLPVVPGHGKAAPSASTERRTKEESP